MNRALLERPYVRNNTDVRTLDELERALVHCVALPATVPYDSRSSYMRSIRAEALVLRAHDLLRRCYRASALVAAAAGDLQEVHVCVHKLMPLDDEMLELAVLCCALLGDEHQLCVTLMANDRRCDAVAAAAHFMAGDYVHCLRHFEGRTALAPLLRERARLEWDRLRSRVLR